MDKKTALYAQHVEAGARMVSFGGFLMPIQYSGIVDEHRAVRSAMGLFDLSHMGEFRLRGDGALAAVDSMVTNDIRSLDVGQIRYTPMCYPDGGIVDDLLVYRFPHELQLVVNASNIEKDFGWVRDCLPLGVQVENISDETALIALQGPKSESLLARFTDLDLGDVGYYHFATGRVGESQVVLSRTGYTGEEGFELYLNPNDAPGVWRMLLEEGAPHGLKPIGLGARDTLRLEAGYMLYGNDIDESTTPLEAGLGWTVKFGPHDFIARDTLEQQKVKGPRRRMVALEMLDRSIPRPHCDIAVEGVSVGQVTSGTFSPTFERGVALGYVSVEHSKVGTSVDIQIRTQSHPAKIVHKPVYKRDGG